MNHADHDPLKNPVLGCDECDKAINRPIPKRYGAGGSSTVLPRPPPPEEEK